MSSPAVSVLIATYNYSTVLRYAVASVLRQTFTDFELIVAGDCCTDDSEEVVRSIDDPRIRWFNLAENSGSKSLPLNAALKIARGKYIAYLGHDDLWHADHLKILVAAIEENDAEFVHTVALYIPPPGQTERPVAGIFPEKFREGYVQVHSSILHLKTAIERTGEWPDYRKTQIPGDQLFWVNAVRAGMRFRAIPRVTVWKFNASSRPGCYIDRRCDEQAHYFKLLKEDPHLGEKDLIAALRAAMIHGLSPLEIDKVGRDAAPGAHIRRLRQIRGLEPDEPMEALSGTITETAFKMEMTAQLPQTVRAGEMLEVEVLLENRSSCKLASNLPYPVHLTYHWLRADGSMAIYDGIRSQIIPPLPAGETRHFFFRFQIPDEPGAYQLQPALVQEGLRWFDATPHNGLFPFEVRAAAPEIVSVNR